MKNVLTVSLRQQAVFVPASAQVGDQKLSQTAASLVANLAKLGYGVSEPLWQALNQTAPTFQVEVLNTFRTVMGVHKNWTPLVKGWDVPTGETRIDHLITWFVNLVGGRGTQLPCGHVIPANTFPLERYNGCPFCGTPFNIGGVVGSQAYRFSNNTKLKVLTLWTDSDLTAFYTDLLESKTALDATQADSLKTLLAELPLPEGVVIGMKEMTMLVMDTFVAANQPEKVQPFLTSPADILRFLWYKHTGFLQLIEPKTIVKRQTKNNRHFDPWLAVGGKASLEKKAALKLKYSRKEGAMVANWLNNLGLSPEQSAEIMHPKRQMWVRFIRALRLAEFSKRPGFEALRELLDVFYNQVYEVWQGQVEQVRLRADADTTFALLKQRPGLFARSLFANILWFGPDETLAAFAEVIDRVPARLVFTLNGYAQTYFDPSADRVVKPLGGVMKRIPANQLLEIYDQYQLITIKSQLEDMTLKLMKNRFAAQPTTSKTMYVAPQLFRMPVSIGDRSDAVQDVPSALMGTRFPLEGDTIRLFMQWGTKLPAQHLDMDLSAYVAYPNRAEYCSFSRLTITGCQHSGDIQYIPDKVGTAEYIELNLNELQRWGAVYVAFACNAYTAGSLTPNLVVGWMNSRHRMTISERTGVAYDPSCVQHQVRITQGLAKGMVFGVLDVAAREVVWLEMPFQGQVVQQFDLQGVKAMLGKLNAKLTIGNLLTIKAEAQGLTLVDNPAADEVYTAQWAANAAAVTRLLVDE